jgi:hypothetical protein
MKTNLGLLITFSFSLVSCTSYNLINNDITTVKGLKLNGERRVSFVIYDSESKRTYILNEPPPDVMMERAATIINNIDVKSKTTDTDVNTNQKIELANKVIQLGERTVAVNILRDALYRLSEMNVNNRNSKLDESYKTLYDSILSISKQIALADILKLKIKENETKTALVKQETEKAEQDLKVLIFKADNKKDK